jgi:hypothetical protein
VAAGAARILAAALLERDNRACTALLDHFGGDDGAIDERRAERRIFTFADCKHLGKFNDVTGVAGDLFDLQDVFGGDAILLAARFNDCEHF